MQFDRQTGVGWGCAGIVQKGGELPCPVDADGRLTEEITDFAGMCDPCRAHVTRVLYPAELSLREVAEALSGQLHGVSSYPKMGQQYV